MTLTIEAIGYDGATALAEIASLFFNRPRIRTDGRIQIPYGDRVRIESLIHEGEDLSLTITTTKFTEDTRDDTRWVASDSISYDIPKDEWRREAKRQLYVILSRETGIYFPWGALTGVRPTQIVCQEIERAKRKGTDTKRGWYAEVLDRMTQYWQLSEQKSALAIETALSEQRILASLAYPITVTGTTINDHDFTFIQEQDAAYPPVQDPPVQRTNKVYPPVQDPPVQGEDTFYPLIQRTDAAYLPVKEPPVHRADAAYPPVQHPPVQGVDAVSPYVQEPNTAYPFVVYVGLPFCPSRCAYCSFIARDAKRHVELLEPYVEAVILEVERTFSNGFKGGVAAVYFGGGTPTSLPAPLFERYLDGVLKSIPLMPDAELTMEAGRPDTIDEETLEIIRDKNFRRLCINPQTMRDETLRAIGRDHTVEETIKAYELARAMGFQDINMDLIAGLPGEGATELLESITNIMELEPESVTLHTLAVKRGSALIEGDVPHAVFHPDRALIDAVEQSHAMLRSYNYAPYYLYRQRNCRSGLENTGFSKEGYASIYNVAMMSDAVPVIGFGSGSTSKAIRGRQANRVHNPKDLSVYISRVEEQVKKKRALFSL
jgi:coproporphyrinogen dehydrogenase HemZ